MSSSRSYFKLFSTRYFCRKSPSLASFEFGNMDKLARIFRVKYYIQSGKTIVKYFAKCLNALGYQVSKPENKKFGPLPVCFNIFFWVSITELLYWLNINYHGTCFWVINTKSFDFVMLFVAGIIKSYTNYWQEWYNKVGGRRFDPCCFWEKEMVKELASNSIFLREFWIES